MDKVVSVFGYIFIALIVIFILRAFLKGIRVGKASLGAIYIKTFPDGSKNYRIQLDKEPYEIREGDRYILEVKNEPLKKEELDMFNGIMEDENE